jgi:hypothetical protein
VILTHFEGPDVACTSLEPSESLLKLHFEIETMLQASSRAMYTERSTSKAFNAEESSNPECRMSPGAPEELSKKEKKEGRERY